MSTFTLLPTDARDPRVAVLGDVGGHAHRLRRVLEKELGVAFDLPHRTSPTGPDWWDVDITWPTDLHVIQVGDLVHRGPDSPGVLQLVDRAMQAGVWTQVVGNHEQLYVGPWKFGWHETLDPASQRLLRHWWEAGTLRPAAGIATSTGLDVVVTHAGLTAGFHRNVLGSTATAGETVHALVALAEDPVLWTPGQMLSGGSVCFDAGPVWAQAGDEVYASWIAANRPDGPPFSQVHGHTSAFWWASGQWLAAPVVRAHLKADTSRRHVSLVLGRAELTGVDPDHGKFPSRVWAPKVFTGAHVL